MAMKTFQQSNRRHQTIGALLGFLLGLGAPMGWLAWQFVYSQRVLLLPWLKGEFLNSGEIYFYLTVGTLTAFTLFGYFLGRTSDAFANQSEVLLGALDKSNTMAVTDALTGIHNARYLHDQLAIETESSKRYNTALACLMIDIDNFKTINDTYGHPFGDTVLINVAKILRQSVRQIDMVGRLGGEEFLVVMPHTDGQMALSVAERIRQAVQRWPFAIDGKEISVTVSIGLAAFPVDTAADKNVFLKAVDEALYQAKRTGKNRTVVSNSMPIQEALK